jgi:hypothetical protein
VLGHAALRRTRSAHEGYQSTPCLLAQPGLHEAGDSPAGPGIGLLQVLTDPRLDVRDLGERVPRRLARGVELGEADAEADVVDVVVDDGVVGAVGYGRVDEEFEEGLAGQGPAL